MTTNKRQPTVTPQLSKTIAGHRLTRTAADIPCGVWEVSGPTVVLAAGIVTIRPLKVRKGQPSGGWIIKRGFDHRVGSAQTVAKVLAEGVRLGWLRPAGCTARAEEKQNGTRMMNAEESSLYYRPGTPGYALRCIREAAGLTRNEAAQLCNVSKLFVKQIELYDAGNPYLWAAMDSLYHMVLAAELSAAQLGLWRNQP